MVDARTVATSAMVAGLDLPFRPERGQGQPWPPSHRWTLYTVPRKELGKGLLAAMLKDLGMDREAF